MSAYARLKHIKTLQLTLPEQGTQEWLEARARQFGGSEIATLLNDSPYQKRAEMIDDKIVKRRFDAAPCSFGRIFEVVAKKFLRELMDYQIYDFSGIKSSMFPIAYSPDGVVFDEKNDQLILLEIKCPYRRNKLAKIPLHYVPQIQAGLNILPVDYGEFIQFRFRLCSLWDVDDTPIYNRWLHWESKKKVADKPPILYGYIQFSDTGPYEDIGKLNPKTEMRITKLPRLRKDMIHLLEVPKRPFRGEIMGFKLFEVATIRVERDPTFFWGHYDAIWSGYLELLTKVCEKKQKQQEKEKDKP